MYLITTSFGRWYLCEHHFAQSDQSNGDTAEYLAHSDDAAFICDMCLSQQASDQSERRAEQRNEMYFHFGRADY